MLKETESYKQVSRVAEQRLADAKSDIVRTWRMFSDGLPLMAEKKSGRRNYAAMRSQVMLREPPAPLGAEAVKGERSNFLPISFLALGTSVSRAVARIRVQETGDVGTGFLCSPNLLITNKHVLNTPHAALSALVEFDFVDDDAIKPSVYRLNPSECFVFDPVEALDFAIVALGNRVAGSEDLSAFGWCPLSDADNKHAIGEFANIIQHPEGADKQVVLQDNLIVSRGDNRFGEHDVLHYVSDTEPGSSGSPVFNNSWQVIALHHWGEATRNFGATTAIDAVGYFDPKSVNQGVRISRIVGALKTRVPSLAARERTLVNELITFGETVLPKDVMVMMETGSAKRRGPSLPVEVQSTGGGLGEGVTTWTLPLKISVSIPGLMPDVPPREPEIRAEGPQPTIEKAAETGLPRTGEGYRPDFLDNHLIDLPKVRASHEAQILPLKNPANHPSAKRGELQFTHFSVIMHKTRKLPFFGACNVDGATLFGINSDGDDYQYDDSDEPIFRASAAEGGFGWKNDQRINKNDQTTDDWYTGKNKLIERPDRDDAEKFIDVADFDRGHIVRRTEPIWGSTEAGKAANYQTFTVVNAAPQTPSFNQSDQRSAHEIAPGEETRSWYGMEVAVLRAATDENKKMNVFTGPIFDDADPIYGPGKPDAGQRQIPLSFWKIAVWEDGGKLQSLAMRSSQAWSLARESGGQEALSDSDQLFLLRDFLTTVNDIEEATGLDFGKKVRDSDILRSVTRDDLAEMSIEQFEAFVRDH